MEHLPGSRVGTGNGPCGTGLGWNQLWIGGSLTLESPRNGSTLSQRFLSFLCQFQEPSLYTIKAVFILDNDGRRLLAKVTPHHRNPEDGAGCHMSKTSGPHPARLTPLGETAFWMAEQPSLGSLEVTLSTLCLNSLTAGGEEGHPLCSYCVS